MIPESDTYWEIDSKVRYRKVLDEAVIIHQDQSEALVVTESAHRFLELCEQKTCFENIVDVLFGEYETSREQLISDLSLCIADLEKHNIVYAVKG